MSSCLLSCSVTSGSPDPVSFPWTGDCCFHFVSSILYQSHYDFFILWLVIWLFQKRGRFCSETNLKHLDVSVSFEWGIKKKSLTSPPNAGNKIRCFQTTCTLSIPQLLCKIVFCVFQFPCFYPNINFPEQMQGSQDLCLMAALPSRLSKRYRTWEPSPELPGFQLCSREAPRVLASTRSFKVYSIFNAKREMDGAMAPQALGLLVPERGTCRTTASSRERSTGAPQLGIAVR